jgi:hypothetical protein
MVLFGLGSILHQTGQTNYHIDTPGRLKIIVPPIMYSLSVLVGCHILNPNTANILVLGMQAMAPRWQLARPRASWSQSIIGFYNTAGHTGGLTCHYLESGAEILHNWVLMQCF